MQELEETDIKAAEKLKVSNADMCAWLFGEGKGHYEVVDKVVTKLISKDAYNEATNAARLYDYVLWKLDLGPNNSTGVRFIK